MSTRLTNKVLRSLDEACGMALEDLVDAFGDERKDDDPVSKRQYEDIASAHAWVRHMLRKRAMGKAEAASE